MTTYELAVKQASSRSAELDNALVEQKDSLLDMLNRCEDGEDFEAWVATFQLVTMSWKALDYEYKRKEILARAGERMHQVRAECISMAMSLRRCPAQQRRLTQDGHKITDIITDITFCRI